MKKILIACLLLAPVAAFAQDALPVTTTVVESSWWQQLFAQVQAPLLSALTAIIGALAIWIGQKAATYLGQKNANLLTEVFQVTATNAAAWAINQIGIDRAKNTVVSSSDPVIKAAVESQMNRSIPDTLKKLGNPTEALKADKIVAALQKIVMGIQPPKKE